MKQELTGVRKHCIFCINPLDKSKEHLIPNCLNGRLTSREILCSACNALFGKNLDNDIKVQMNPILLFMGFKNAQEFYVYSGDQKKYLMKKNMTMEPILPEVQLVKKKGKNHIRLTGKERDINNVLKKMNELLQEKIKGAKFVAQESKSQIGIVPGTHAPLNLKITGKTILLFNKIALEFFALKKGNLEEVGPLLKKVHALDTSIDNVIFCNKGNELRDFDPTEMSHLIYLQGDAATKTLRVYIELFNVFCGVVNLSDSYSGSDMLHYYYQDAGTGKQIETEPRLKRSLSENITDRVNEDDLSELCSMQAERHRERYVMEVVDLNLKGILQDLKDAAAKGKIKEEEIANLYLQASANLIAQITFEVPYSIEMEEGKPPHEDDRYNFYHSNFNLDKIDAFTERNKQLLNVKIVIDGELFHFRSFHQEPFSLARNIHLLTLYIAAESVETKQTHYIPVRKVFEILNRARPMEADEIKEYTNE